MSGGNSKGNVECLRTLFPKVVSDAFSGKKKSLWNPWQLPEGSP